MNEPEHPCGDEFFRTIFLHDMNSEETHIHNSTLGAGGSCLLRTARSDRASSFLHVGFVNTCCSQRP
jgi:hypothetical protein